MTVCSRIAIATVLLGGGTAWGDVYSYECDSLPIQAGWTLLQAWCDPLE